MCCLTYDVDVVAHLVDRTRHHAKHFGVLVLDSKLQGFGAIHATYYHWPMKINQEIRTGRHCVFMMHVHLVFVAKYRRQVFDADAIQKLRLYFASVCEDFEAELVENERQLEALGGAQSSLESELECLRDVLEHPDRYLSVEPKQLRLSTINVVLDNLSTDVASDVAFSLVELNGTPQLQRAFVLARFDRAELPEDRINFANAARCL